MNSNISNESILEDKFNFPSKLKRFFISIFLDLLIADIIYNFVKHLSDKGIIKIGVEFNPHFSIIWGDEIISNLVAIFIVGIKAGLFGFVFGYLSRKLSKAEKIVYTFSYVLVRYLALILADLLIMNFFPNYSVYWWNNIMFPYFSIFNSTNSMVFFVLQNIIMFIIAFYFIKLGINKIKTTDDIYFKESNNTLLGVKFYHLLWLFYPIGIYGKILLNCSYEFATFLPNLQIFGGNGIDDGYLGSLTIIVAIFFLMRFLRKLLLNEIIENKFIQILLSITIGIIIPTVVVIFTKLGD